MPNRRLEVKKHLSNEELKARYRSCKESKEARRWHVLWLVSQGYSSQEAADIVGLESTWVRRIIHRYNKDGPESVVDGHLYSTRRPKFRLTPDHQRLLYKALKAEPPDGGEWTGSKVASWIEQLTGVKIYPQMGWSYLERVGLTLKPMERNHQVGAAILKEQKFKNIQTDDKANVG